MKYDILQEMQRFLDSSPYATRILCELNYAAALSKVNDNAFDATLERAIECLKAAVEDDGVITKAAALTTEKILLPLQDAAKKYRVHMVSHAHIDMNWMWGFQETVAVTVDTFRTVLDLMQEYPMLTFGQSQASTYEIIETYAPTMLPEIKERIREGRWEVTASTWVEPDKNLPSGESLARHILYTRRYLSELLDLDPSSLNLDFEPDTFGHNVAVPDICLAGGVKYYYHCRGREQTDAGAYRWRGRSGAELLVWCEPHWYNYVVDQNCMKEIPLLCKKNGIDDYLMVFGVGDHGGGPTRRCIERLIEMSSWPIMPTMQFGTYGGFFAALEKNREQFPIATGELNFLFDGCYTSQSKIKMANRIAEDRILESETLDTAAGILGGESFPASFRTAWKHILFNHFHDILPGSGVVDTREHAMGRFQDAMAHIGTSAGLAMRSIARKINTEAFDLDYDRQTKSEGSGVGYRTGSQDAYRMPCVERGLGKTRLFHLFNPTQYDFDGVTELTVFEWMYDDARAVFTAADGTRAAHKILEVKKGYWGHTYKKYALSVKVPAYGYASYQLTESPANPPSICSRSEPRLDHHCGDDIVMENEKIIARFDHRTVQLRSLVDRATGRQLIEAPAACFRYVTENSSRGMTAWRVGDYMSVVNLNETSDVRLTHVSLDGCRQSMEYSLSFAERSSLKVCISLDENSPMLCFDVTVDFHETGSKEKGIPQLNFALPLGYASEQCRYDVPFGTLDRVVRDYDVPANSFAMPLAKEGGVSLLLVSDSKYGFRYARDEIALTLLRASYDPDRYPEYGIHRMRLGVGGCVPSEDRCAEFGLVSSFVHPISYCSADLKERGGALEPVGRFLKVEGGIKVTGLKSAEQGSGVILRFSNPSDVESEYRIALPGGIQSATLTDLNEFPLKALPLVDGVLVGECLPHAIQTILLQQ